MNLTTTQPPPIRQAFADRTLAGGPLVHGQPDTTMARSWVQFFSAVQNPVASSSTNLKAKIGGGQTGATPIQSAINKFTTVTNNGDSALLPPSFAGAQIVIINATAHSLNIYPFGTDTVNAGAPSAFYTLAANTQALFSCPELKHWYAISGS